MPGLLHWVGQHAWRDALPSLAHRAGPSLELSPASSTESHLGRILLAYLQRLERAAGGAWQQPKVPGAAGSRSATPAALPFQLAVLPSTIPGAGRGLFLTTGRLEAGAIVTLYPGLVYTQEDFLQLCSVPAEDAQAISPPPFTLYNHSLLMLRCCGQLLLTDGCPCGLSARRFLGAAAEAAESSGAPLNSSWVERSQSSAGNERAHESTAAAVAGDGWGSGMVEIEAALMRQAAAGHLVNHPPPDGTASLQFAACVLPAAGDLPLALLRWLPSLPFQARGRYGSSPERAGELGQPRWVPLLVARRALQADASTGPVELFADYGADPLGLGFRP